MCARFLINEEFTLEISKSLIKDLLQFRQLNGEPESGGVFVGKRLLDGTISVIDFSKPSVDDYQERYRFSKKSKSHQKFVDEYYDNSSGFISLIGEWHTHPEKFPSASKIDKNSWGKIISENDARLFFLIVGIESATIYFIKSRRWETSEINLGEYID